MAFDWSQYLVLAEEIAEQPGNEAALRSAVSRAYYAAFCLAREHLLNTNKLFGSKPRRPRLSHQTVWLTYGRDVDRRIGVDGNRLRELRNLVDYEDMVPNLDNAVRSALSTSRRILASLDELS